MIKFTRWTFSISVFLLCIPLSAFGRELPKARITLKIIDEDGTPVSNAVVSIGFIQGGNGMTGRSEGKDFKGLSDTNGLYAAQAKTLGDVGFSVEKEGFYRSMGHYAFVWDRKDRDKWQPWNPTIKMLLKTIDNPVPMYAMRVNKELPLFGKPVGFDLEKGDLVAPHGKGLVNDFIFTFTGEFRDWRIRDEDLVLEFGNKNDGMQEVISDPNDTSKFKLFKQAPLEGYLNKLMFSKRATTLYEKVKKVGIKENQNFVFRVRTVLDKDGNIIGTNYGKIYGQIEFGFSDPKKVEVSFVYYLNPDGTRNLEFDPTRNLFKNLGRFEEVSAP